MLIVCFFMSVYALEFVKVMSLDMHLSYFPTLSFLLIRAAQNCSNSARNHLAQWYRRDHRVDDILFAFRNRIIRNPTGFAASLIFNCPRCNLSRALILAARHRVQMRL